MDKPYDRLDGVICTTASWWPGASQTPRPLHGLHYASRVRGERPYGARFPVQEHSEPLRDRP